MTQIQNLDSALDKLCCPETHAPLVRRDDSLVTVDGGRRYEVSPVGVPLFAKSNISPDAARQRDHYDQALARQYAENLAYPHTQEYMAYLDRVFVAELASGDLSDVAEICCGQGEVIALKNIRIVAGVGVDISAPMLESALDKHAGQGHFTFVQGDATRLPLQSGQFSSVAMLGGIHHVRDRKTLFVEVFRILKPGGRFFFREPVSDFFLWRWIRSVVYRVSPALDAETERPLTWAETVPVLEEAGFRLRSWRTYGFLGFCLFMNSDVLVFNRLFRFIPGIRRITRFWTRVDDFTTRLPHLGKSGLQVVGVAEKPFVEKS